MKYAIIDSESGKVLTERLYRNFPEADEVRVKWVKYCQKWDIKPNRYKKALVLPMSFQNRFDSKFTIHTESKRVFDTNVCKVFNNEILNQKKQSVDLSLMSKISRFYGR